MKLRRQRVPVGVHLELDLQVAIFVIGLETLQAMTVLFNLGGWLCALGGLALYLAWLRPSLAHR